MAIREGPHAIRNRLLDRRVQDAAPDGRIYRTFDTSGMPCAHRGPCRGDSDTSTVWHIPAEAITTVALVSFIERQGRGQFIALACRPALASVALERRSSLVVRPWVVMAARKWSAVMARAVGWSGVALASFTQRRAARWQT
jgi:hypothetical protein